MPEPRFSGRAQEDFELWQSWKKDPSDETLTPLVQQMQPLVNKVVNTYALADVPESAVRNVANIYLIKAIETYDPYKVGKTGQPAALATHATWKLKKVKSWVAQHQNIGRIPDHRVDRIADFKQGKQELTEQLGHPPDARTLASHLGAKWSVAEVTRMEKELQPALIASRSLEVDLLPEIESSKERDVLRYIYEDLDADERLVLEYSLGLNGKPKLSATEIARMTNYSQPKISRIRRKIDQKLRERGV
jgi:DNA-directed RNA polymerase specialized sigma subunit